jgi:hypothetical protein
MKKSKIHKENHVAPTKFGMGDNYGTGIKAKIGKPIRTMGIEPLKSKNLGNPPKSLA